MDGYAIRGADSFGASSFGPLSLAVVGESLPGQPFAGVLGPGQAVRIMTGAPVPEGADAVVMAEVCRQREGQVELREAVAPRKNVGARGEDVRGGTVVLRAGRRLRPQDAGLLASIGVASVECVRRPRVRLTVTGDEDPVTFEPILPAGRSWTDVLAGVDRIEFTTFVPGFFFGFTNFDLSIDNVSIAPAMSSNSFWSPRRKPSPMITMSTRFADGPLR